MSDFDDDNEDVHDQLDLGIEEDYYNSHDDSQDDTAVHEVSEVVRGERERKECMFPHSNVAPGVTDPFV